MSIFWLFIDLITSEEGIHNSLFVSSSTTDVNRNFVLLFYDLSKRANVRNAGVPLSLYSTTGSVSVGVSTVIKCVRLNHAYAIVQVKMLSSGFVFLFLSLVYYFVLLSPDTQTEPFSDRKSVV